MPFNETEFELHVKSRTAIGVAAMVCLFVSGCSGNTPDGAASGDGATSAAGARTTEPVPGATAQDNPGTGEADAASVKMENLLADCMKAHGFVYVPHPDRYSTSSSDKVLAGRDPALVPYNDLKNYRQKYGFAIFARDVYPGDPNLNADPPQAPNPNTAIRAALPPAQQRSYDKYLGGGEAVAGADGKVVVPAPGICKKQAYKKAYGDGDPATGDPAAQAKAQQARQAFETDSQLLQAAQTYASCLRHAGYTVSTAKPGTIEHTVEQIEQNLRDQRPDTLDTATARQGLDHEIKAALDDLECGKDYEAKAKPKVEKMVNSGGVG